MSALPFGYVFPQYVYSKNVEIVFSFYVKDNNIFLWLHNIRLTYTI